MQSKNIFSAVGVVFAAVAIVVAVFQNEIRDPGTGESTGVRDRLVDQGLKAIGVEMQPLEEGVDIVTITYRSLGTAAVLCGLVAFIREENRRIFGVAITLGLIAASWEYVLFAVIIATVIFLLLNFS